jgi:hypothetical protein
MTQLNDVYWDELGIAWRAISPDPNVIAPQLELRLCWQAACMRIAVLLGLSLGLLGIALGIWTIWIGWRGDAWNFVTRGIAIVAISTMMAFAARSLGGGVRNEIKSLSEMIDLAILRAERSIIAIRLGYYGCAVAAVFGLIGYGIRSYLSRPPAMSPIEPLIALALLSLILFLYRRKVADNVGRYQYLKRFLAAEGH